MAQFRVGNFGETATSEIDNLWRSIVLAKGVYNGFELGVDAVSSNLTIAPGAGVQPDGIVWTEDTEVQLSFTPPGIATDYTVIAYHTNRAIFGGMEVTYELATNIIGNDTISDGVAIGWIRHPGGGGPLDVSYLQNAPRQTADLYSALLVETAPVARIPPYPTAYLDTATVGPDITVTPFFFDVATFTMLQRVSRTVAGVPGIQTAVQHHQFYTPSGGYRPFSFDFWLNFTAAPTRELRVEVYDTNQSPVTILSGTPILSTAGWEQKTAFIDPSSGTFDADKPWTLRLTFQVDAGGTIDTGRIRMRSFPYP